MNTQPNDFSRTTVFIAGIANVYLFLNNKPIKMFVGKTASGESLKYINNNLTPDTQKLIS